MSHPYPVAPTGNTPRPSTVRISSYLLMFIAALWVLNAVIGLSTIGAVSRVYREVYEGTPLAQGSGYAVAAVGVGVALMLLWAVALVVLALLNNRGRNPARIVTWVLGGISICCSGVGLLTNAVSGVVMQSGNTANQSEELQRRVEELMPSWSRPVELITGILTLLAMIAALTLLALPASNAFFRKPATGWPHPGQAYPSAPPQYPGQSQYPGQPQYPGQQPDPGAQQPYPGQQSFPGQQYPGQQYPGQPYPGQQYPGQQQPDQPSYPGPSAYPPPSPQPGEERSDGRPATDPWDQPDRPGAAPPNDPTSPPKQ